MELGPDLDALMANGQEPDPALVRYMERYIVEDFSGVEVVFLKESVEAAYDAIEPGSIGDDGILPPDILDKLAEGSINPNLN